MTKAEQDLDAIDTSETVPAASGFRSDRRRRWMRRLLAAFLSISVLAIIGRQLTKPRWHTLYSHRQPNDALVLAVECPQGWEETTDASLSGSNFNSIMIRPKPSVGWPHWWQQHILRQSDLEQSITLILTDSPAVSTPHGNISDFTVAGIGDALQITIDNPTAQNAAAVRETPAVAESKAMSDMEEMLLSMQPFNNGTMTMKRTRHPLGEELDTTIVLSQPGGSPLPSVSLSATTIILPVDSLADKAKAITIDSEENDNLGSESERIRNEIIRRVRIVKR